MTPLENADKLLDSALEHRNTGAEFHQGGMNECMPEYMAAIAESLLALALIERSRLERELRERPAP